MRVFVTGATGFIGSALVPELIGPGHHVLGMARSDAGAKALAAAGAQVHRGDIYDLESIRAGATKADAVIHLAFNHDFSKFVENCETDRRVVETLGSALGKDKILVITSGTGMGTSTPGHLITENDPPVSSQVIPRAASEEEAAKVAARGVRVAVVRLPQVHDTRKQGLVTYAIQMAREKGVSAYLGDGGNRWPAAHVTDVARLYRLALEKTGARATYHAVAEEGVPVRDIAEAIGRGLKVPVVSIKPEEAAGHFGWLAHFVGWDIGASSTQTRAQLGWNPTGPDILTDLNNMNYSQR
jgi:nucleoside-diphosphate-sugar epimerase